MALPHLLQAPPVVTQEPARCWAAAYESWSRGMARFLNITATTGGQDVIRWFEDGRGLVTPAGRATDAGVALLGGIGFMRLRRMRSAAVTMALLDRLLNEGYIYCAYYWTSGGSRRGHAIVIYGAEDGRFHFMDPAPERGLVSERASFLAQQSHTVILGTSLLSGLARSVGRSFEQILSGPQA